MTQHPQHGQILNNSTLWKVGCGDKFKFWEDNWLGGAGSLLDKYPRLYTISSQQNQIIQHMGTVKDSGWEWEFKWRRPMFDNELDMAISFLKDVESHNIQQQERDQWVWMADSNGHYSVRSAYNVLREDIAEEIQDGAFEEMRKLKVPTKIATFAWRLFRDRLPTKTNLRKRQIELDDFLCPFCIAMEETTGHLFFHCSKILPVWWESLSWANRVGAFPIHPRHHFLQHIHGGSEEFKANRWNWWWLALTWTIWRHRNNIVFSRDAFNPNKVFDYAVFLLWTWLRHMEKDFHTHYNQWSANIRPGLLRR